MALHGCSAIRVANVSRERIFAQLCADFRRKSLFSVKKEKFVPGASRNLHGCKLRDKLNQIVEISIKTMSCDCNLFSVIKNTEDYLIIGKNPNVTFQTTEKQPGLLKQIREMEEEGSIVAGPRLFPVHRLDRITSGILIFARSRKNANSLSNEFRHGRVEKYYIALSDRKPRKKQGCIRGDMILGRRGQRILTRNQKRPAITHFKSEAMPNRRPGMRLFLLKPQTGRTHQIRVAMKSIGSPILGDHLYGRYDCAREEDRAYLHACFLRVRLFDDLITVKSKPSPGIEFETPEFEKIWKQLQGTFTADDSPQSHRGHRDHF